MVDSARPVVSNMGPNESSAKSNAKSNAQSNANNPPVKKTQLGLPQPELVFYPPSENFPYRLKGEPSILELLHNTDWSQTVLGPAKDWCSILIDSIRLALVSRFAMCIWWGSDLVQVSAEKKVPS